jgi:hypothetical protein
MKKYNSYSVVGYIGALVSGVLYVNQPDKNEIAKVISGGMDPAWDIYNIVHRGLKNEQKA